MKVCKGKVAGSQEEQEDRNHLGAGQMSTGVSGEGRSTGDRGEAGQAIFGVRWIQLAKNSLDRVDIG